jgi:hypothetical protein
VSHYGYYYPLIDYWMEAEWHAVRHRTYGTDTCILSSDWHMREVFDFDRTSMVTYVADVTEDSRPSAQQFGSQTS